MSGRSSFPENDMTNHNSPSSLMARNQVVPFSTDPITENRTDTVASNSLKEDSPLHPLNSPSNPGPDGKTSLTAVTCYEGVQKDMGVEFNNHIEGDPISTEPMQVMRGINIGTSKTWRRTSSKSGRLQRQQSSEEKAICLLDVFINASSDLAAITALRESMGGAISSAWVGTKVCEMSGIVCELETLDIIDIILRAGEGLDQNSKLRFARGWVGLISDSICLLDQLTILIVTDYWASISGEI
ncbi:tRNA dimethylallyltransferase [Striga asiatica]|uniref:tRNA dimethylallyltransferase n=1 Tax=Striga asiatica TaxID=4170 RepID=A0A5A7RKV5_STRAF|nr:tRNA dimethylallyltransferase [Striga asiatica]